MTNDLISREAALEILMKYCPDDDGSCSKADIDPREMLDEIESLPTVDVAPVVHGRWKESDFIPGMLTCTNCGTQRNPKFKLGAGAWYYCPNCGAKMDKEANY